MKGNDARPFRILSLDGGGIRGAFTAAFLSYVERTTKVPIARHFDLIAGTSTGGIIAAALALGEPAEKIEALYRNRGAAIFTRRKRMSLGWWRFWRHLAVWRINKRLAAYGMDCDYLLQSKYEATALKTALVEILGERTIEACTHRLIMPTVDLSRGQTVMIKTPHLPNLTRDRKVRVADAILATTAAPTYFPHAEVQPGSAYIDGGVWANNPAFAAFTEAMKIRAECKRPDLDREVDIDRIQILSIGTGTPIYALAPPAGGAGLGWWAPNLINVVTLSQAQGVNFQMQYILGDRYRRVDFDIPDKSWLLDNIAVLPQLLHLGRTKAEEKFPGLRDTFFTGEAPPYHPFPDHAPAAPPAAIPVGQEAAGR